MCGEWTWQSEDQWCCRWESFAPSQYLPLFFRQYNYGRLQVHIQSERACLGKAIQRKLNDLFRS